MFRRTITERVTEVAPFLSYDGDPYLVIRDDGSLVWVWDAYTTTSRFPYSQPRSTGVNYIRNSIKVVVDAYNGKVTLYQVDPKDALATAWSKVFPDLITPGSKMPDDIRRNLRYPEDMFSLQAQVLATYHMTDPQVFYNKQDMWEIPKEIVTGGQQHRWCRTTSSCRSPGIAGGVPLLPQPFLSVGRSDMSALAGRPDGRGALRRTGRLQLPEGKHSLRPGPDRDLPSSQDPAISAQLTLWDQSGSSVIRGNLLVIPIEDAVLYVEPLYLQADQGSIPSMKRVILSVRPAGVMEPTLGEALDKLFGPGASGSTRPPPRVRPRPRPRDHPRGTTTTTTPGADHDDHRAGHSALHRPGGPDGTGSAVVRGGADGATGGQLGQVRTADRGTGTGDHGPADSPVQARGPHRGRSPRMRDPAQAVPPGGRAAPRTRRTPVCVSSSSRGIRSAAGLLQRHPGGARHWELSRLAGGREEPGGIGAR